MKICLECHNLIKPDVDLGIGNKCPIKYCCGKIVETDDQLIHVIQQLNEKGYSVLTNVVHSESEFVEIIFDKKVHPDAFAFLPKGFLSGITEDCYLRLYKLIIGETKSDRIKSIRESSVELIEWNDKLSTAKCITVDLKSVFNIGALELMNEIYFKLHVYPVDFGCKAKFVAVVSPEKVDIVKNQIGSFESEKDEDIQLNVTVQ